MSRDNFPSFSGLKAFYEVGLTGSAARAGERLGVSKSSISHQLKAFEQELGVRLLENRKGKLYLTPDGETYFQAIEKPMSDILEATSDLRSAPGQRRVSLTLTPSFAANWLMPRLQDLTNKHPDIELNLITTTRVTDLHREKIDVAIRRGTGKWPNCSSELLLSETIVPVMSPSYWESFEDTEPSSVFEAAKILVNTTLMREWDGWFSDHRVPPSPQNQRFNLETYELTISAACDGLGIALGRKPLIGDLISNGDLIAPFDDLVSDKVSYYLVHKEGPQASDVARLINWLRSHKG